jgi:hypothetical protein
MGSATKEQRVYQKRQSDSRLAVFLSLLSEVRQNWNSVSLKLSVFSWSRLERGIGEVLGRFLPKVEIFMGCHRSSGHYEAPWNASRLRTLWLFYAVSYEQHSRFANNPANIMQSVMLGNSLVGIPNVAQSSGP